MGSFANLEELLDARKRYYEAIESGNEEAANEVLSHIKLNPHIAIAVKTAFGRDGVEMIRVFDLSDVEKEYGEGWGNAEESSVEALCGRNAR